jgi:Putative Ig domain
MRMDPETSAVIWIPKPGQEGMHKVTIKASDPYGASSTQTFQIHVAPK